MVKQAVEQAFENHSLEVALEALAASIARWTEQGDQLVTAIPRLSLWRREELNAWIKQGCPHREICNET